MPERLLTKASIKCHIRSNGCDVHDKGCLYCKRGGVSTTDQNREPVEYLPLDYSSFQVTDDGNVEQTVSCQECGRRWIDVFRLADVREIE